MAAVFLPYSSYDTLYNILTSNFVIFKDFALDSQSLYSLDFNDKILVIFVDNIYHASRLE